jgi:POT family proton-dependent oligopeptide transporter
MNTKNKIFTLLTAEIIGKLNFWGIQSTLLLYLTNILKVQPAIAYAFYAAFTSLTFLTAVVGGILADRFFGFFRVLFVSIILTCLGNIILSFFQASFIILGLTLISCGTGLFMPTVASLLGLFNYKSNNQRQKIFSIFYMCTNIGAILGPIFFSLLLIYNLRYAFAAIGATTLIWIFYYIYCFENKITFLKYNFITKKNLLLNVIILFILAITYFLMLYQKTLGISLGTLACFFVVGLITLSFYKLNILDRKKILMLLLMIGITLFFFSCAFQIYSSLTMFIEKFVNRRVLNLSIPASSFSSLEPFFILILAPFAMWLWEILNKKSMEPPLLIKIILGLLLASGGFLVFALAAKKVTLIHDQISMGWIVGGNFLLGLGEICIMPSLISAISFTAPLRFKGTVMGLLYLSFAFSGYLAAIISKITSTNTLEEFNQALDYFTIYLKISILAAAIACFILIISLKAKKYIVKNEKV